MISSTPQTSKTPLLMIAVYAIAIAASKITDVYVSANMVWAAQAVVMPEADAAPGLGG